MSDFKILFTNYWLLLLLIPAAALAFWSYFRVSRRYRRTRNRITSLVLFMIVMVLSVSVLAGISFAYKEPNKTNEVILLVDVSYSNKSWKNSESTAPVEEKISVEDRKDRFIKSVLDSSDSIFKIGIITFARETNYVAKLSYDTEEVYKQYLSSLSVTPPKPDDSATDIAAALNFAKDCFTNPKSGKIVLITDGIETDGNAMSVIMAVAAKGITVDTVIISDESNYGEVQITGIEFPDSNIIVDESVTLKVSLQSSFEGPATIVLYDNGQKGASEDVSLSVSMETPETFGIKYTFTKSGPHEIYFTITSEGDTITQNNSYYAYLFLDVYEKILILEKTDESAKLKPLLEQDFETVHVKNINEAPATMKELRNYDEIILMNIANSDMTEDFSKMLYDYVYTYGGGLLTVGGDEDVLDENGHPVNNPDGSAKKQAHAYNRADMNTGSTWYRDMLPVNCIDYTPPLALMLVIDRSDSMIEKDNSMGKTRLDLAKQGALTCLNSLSDRDYCGVVSFSHNVKKEIKLSSKTQYYDSIRAAIDRITTGGNTEYVEAIKMAGEELLAIQNVEKRHIIFVTDGLPNDETLHQEWIEHYYSAAGITLSVVVIGGDTSGIALASEMAKLGHGKSYDSPDSENLAAYMAQDLKREAIMEYKPEKFTPAVNSWQEEMRGITVDEQNPFPQLGGFYGTKARPGAVVILNGPYDIPIYAKWKFGEGRVGSFMSNLSGEWADDFLSSESGIRFIINAIRALSPTEDISEKDIGAKIESDNYTQYISVVPVAQLNPGESIRITVSRPNDNTAAGQPDKITDPPFTLDKTSIGKFTVSQPGVYYFLIEIVDGKGDPVANPCIIQTAFSYSAEYNVFVNEEDAYTLLINLAAGGRGALVAESEPGKVLSEFKMTLDKTIDPRLAFIIIAVILFLLDIAVRKFKWKWPHEIIRDYKAKRLLKQGRS